jgi:hypothetical protein
MTTAGVWDETATPGSEGGAAQAVGRSAVAFFPVMYPWAVQRPSPCWLKPPADSPLPYRPGITWPYMSITWHLALMRRLARVSWMSGVAQAA